MQVIYHPEAEEEMLASARYYENCATNLGFKFLDDLDKTVNEILEFPNAWVSIDDNIHRHLFQHFPYGILYTVIAQEIRILAIMHLHQKPGYWKDRK